MLSKSMRHAVVAGVHLSVLCAVLTSRGAAGNANNQVPATGSTALANDISVCGDSMHQKPTALDGMDLRQIADFRIQRVKLHKDLKIYPDDYDPLKGTSLAIYQPITPGKDWVWTTPYYVANPYHLLTLAPANWVLPLNVLCPDVSISCKDRTIEEKRTGNACSNFFKTVFTREPAVSGKVRIMNINAYDAGFLYASVDPDQSENVEPEPGTKNIMGHVYSRLCIYHVGRYGKNNLSPEDRNAWLVLKKKDVFTRITVRLWRKAPASVKDAPDRVCVFLLEP